MCNNYVKQFFLLLVIIFSSGTYTFSQRFLTDHDSIVLLRDTVLPIVRKFNNLSITGYMQPQFQATSKEGVETYEGGNFQKHAANRFMIRRARVKIDYLLPRKGVIPKALFTFQFEATERDMNIRDMFVRIYEPKKEDLSLFMGLFSRPFGYEVNLSSSYRETPERGRMSQILMPSERDLGAMLSYNVASKEGNSPMKLDFGVFNGQGKAGPAEFDSYKDIISRVTINPHELKPNVSVSAGLSYFNGGWRQETKYKYETALEGGTALFKVDSSIFNIGRKAPKKFYGADMQIAIKHAWGKTEVRGEYWKGKTGGSATSTTNPGTLPTGPTYIRNFDGAFIYFLQNIINEHWELMAKYDWYDPNVKVMGTDIGKAGSNLTEGDIKYGTFGLGITRYFSDHLKALIYYSMPRNELTNLPGYTSDLDDNVFTFRVQLRF